MSLPCMKAREAHFDCSAHEVPEMQEEIVSIMEEIVDKQKTADLQGPILAVVCFGTFAALVAAGKAIMMK